MIGLSALVMEYRSVSDGNRSTAPPEAGQASPLDRRRVFDASRTTERAAGENFPVAAFFLPRRWRAHLMAVYGFARLVDDVGDEAEGDRLGLLDEIEADLRRLRAGHAVIDQVRAVGRTIHVFDLSLQPFFDLIEANRLDQVVIRYRGYEDLVGYCRLSAAPVGRIVLEIMGEATPTNLALSDEVSIALQLVEHLQDVGEDYRRGRVYLPLDDLAACGCPVELLGGSTATAPVRRTVALMAGRAEELLGSGRVLSHRLRPLARLAVAGYTAGGLAALDAIAGNDFDVLGGDSRPSRARVAARGASVAFGPVARTRP